MGCLSKREHQVSLVGPDLVNVNASFHATMHQVSNGQLPRTVILRRAIIVVPRIAGGLCHGEYSLAASCRIEKEMITHSDSGFGWLPKPNGRYVVIAVEGVPSDRNFA